MLEAATIAIGLICHARSVQSRRGRGLALGLMAAVMLGMQALWDFGFSPRWPRRR